MGVIEGGIKLINDLRPQIHARFRSLIPYTLGIGDLI